jgi:cytidylate kinase
MAIRPPDLITRKPKPHPLVEIVIKQEDQRRAQREARQRERERKHEAEIAARDARDERQAIQIMEQAEEARAMRCAGAKYNQIAAKLGVSMSVAYDRAARLTCGVCSTPCR